MPIFRIETCPHAGDPSRPAGDAGLVARLREADLESVESVFPSRLFFLEGALTRPDAESIARSLLADPLTESWRVVGAGEPIPAPDAGIAFEVHLRPGVMDPVAESTLAELRAEGRDVDTVRTARRYVVSGGAGEQALRATVGRVLANDCIERVVFGAAPVEPAPRPPVTGFKLRHVPIRDLDDAGLEQLARGGHLFLALDEMRAIQAHFRALQRDATDLELETLAQTWSEHCVHKTFKSAIVYRGAPMPATRGEPVAAEPVEIRYSNLLKDTIARATGELAGRGRGPECLSVFEDNAGIIAFDEQFGIAFKVETHNHPSAIEPYGGAATGAGGCIRDIIGCGLAARPIANTDVFCVAPPDWPNDRLPKGVLHPRRVLRGVVRGVADYGNRMGIPTVNGAIHFDPRYLGNPLVFCGCVGLIPRNRIDKAARACDLILLIGGRTGRDGIHGATFSSAELTDTHADEFSHAVQIGNAITEKRFLDAVLRARDAEGGCLFSAITDCGAGGLSSAVGEMAERVGARVELETVPLKYAGLRYDEIWISEAQERMVLAVPPENLDAVLEIMREEEVDASVIGEFGSPGADAVLVVHYEGHAVGELDMRFLHGGLPKRERVAEWTPGEAAAPERAADGPPLERLRELLRSPTVAAKTWVIRQYDHEVQGGSVIKPLCGPGNGPSDGAVLRPRLDSSRGVAVACGLAPQLSDRDPYWMAIAAIDEALRNVVCVGGDPRRTAILDNFCWGRVDDPRQLGALVRACQACYDGAVAYELPFISGKDSLNNEFALDAGDVDVLVETLRSSGADGGLSPFGTPEAIQAVEARLRETRRLSIPGTLLISALSLIDDAARCVSADLKRTGDSLRLIGALPLVDFSLEAARAVHHAVADAIQRGMIAACHDVSEGGWLVAVAEMAIGGDRGVEITADLGAEPRPFEPRSAAYVVETSDAGALESLLASRGVDHVNLGTVRPHRELHVDGRTTSITEIRRAWTSHGA